jgi:hypothetical protein
MTQRKAVEALLASAGHLAALKERRGAWVRKTAAAWRDAHHEMDDRLGEAAVRLSEEEFERLCDQEQAKVDAIRQQISDVIDKDRWPKELYWGAI